MGHPGAGNQPDCLAERAGVWRSWGSSPKGLVRNHGGVSRRPHTSPQGLSCPTLSSGTHLLREKKSPFQSCLVADQRASLGQAEHTARRNARDGGPGETLLWGTSQAPEEQRGSECE